MNEINPEVYLSERIRNQIRRHWNWLRKQHAIDMADFIGGIIKNYYEDDSQESKQVSELEAGQMPVSKSPDSPPDVSSTNSALNSNSQNEGYHKDTVKNDSLTVESTVTDIKTARRCMDFTNLGCGNKNCLNESCPLNKVYDKQDNHAPCECGGELFCTKCRKSHICFAWCPNFEENKRCEKFEEVGNSAPTQKEKEAYMDGFNEALEGKEVSEGEVNSQVTNPQYDSSGVVSCSCDDNANRLMADKKPDTKLAKSELGGKE